MSSKKKMNFKILIVCLSLLLVQQCAFSLYLFPIPHFIFGDALYNYGVNRSQLVDTKFDTGYIDQDVDHFNMRGDGSVTFKQRYFYKNEYFNNYTAARYAILELMGPDGTPYMEHDEINKWAELKQAMYYKLEHRYYGKSRPTQDLTTKNLVFKEYSQSLVDAMNFIKQMDKKILKENYKKGKVKWLITGRGYGGMLAAWFAAKYSHQNCVDIDRTIAIDSPMMANVSFTDFFKVAEDIIREGYQRTVKSRTCGSNLDQLKADFFSKLATDSQSLMQMFNLCSVPKNIPTQDSIRLQHLIFGVIPFMVQYNRNILYSSNYGYGNLCAKLEDNSLGNTVLERYGTFIRDLLKLTKYQCIDYTYERLVKDLSIKNWSDDPHINDERIFFHQRCTQFGWFISSSASHLPYDYIETQKLCTDVFGQKYSTKQLEHQIQNTNRETGGDKFKVIEGSAIFFVNGRNDTWNRLKIPNPNLIVEGASHCSFLSRIDAEEVEPAGMDDARKRVQSHFVNRNFVNRMLRGY